MEKNNIEFLIRQYCQKRKNEKSVDALNHSKELKLDVDLSSLFSAYYEKRELINSTKLSFKFTLPKSKTSGKLVQQKNVEKILKKVKKSKKNEEIPEAFLLLLDDLCINRNQAKTFFDNKDQWTFVKSDRKIYCAAKGSVNQFVLNI
jgi:hypothetical protein